MAVYSRTIGRQVTNGMPAWRAAMTATDRVYAVGGLPSNAGAELVWPAAGQGGVLMSGGGDANTFKMHYSYGGAVFADEGPEFGPHGAMIFGGTGENSIHHQLTYWTASEDAPRWRMYQQPDFPTSLTEAVARDADAYWSQADFAALPSGKKIDIVGEAAFVSGWDDTFPVGVKDWVIRRKPMTSLIGNSTPHFFRYNMPRFIPSSMTGTGRGAIIVNSRGTQYGPFAQGPTPSGMTPESRWFGEAWGSNRRKHFLFAMDVQTKAWQRLANPIADFAGYVDLASPYSCVDRANKRIYYSTYNGSSHALYYADFSAGLSGMTVVGPTNLTDLASGPGMSQAANCVLAVPTSGPNAGRRLWYLRDAGATPALLLIDLDNNTLRKLTITGLPSAAEWWCFAFRASTGELIISTKQPSLGLVKSYRIAIPTDPTSAAGYSVVATTLTFDTGVSLEDIGGWQYGERNAYLESLGVILMTQRDGKMLAYRPGT